MERDEAARELQELGEQIAALVNERYRIEDEIRTLRYRRLAVERLIRPGVSNDIIVRKDR